MNRRASSVGDSLKAWSKVSATSVILALAILLIYLATMGNSADSSGLWFIGGLSALVHLAAVAIVGIPFFLRFWPDHQSPVWSPSVCILLGFILGYVGMFAPAAILASTSQVTINRGMFSGCLIGGAYGVLTALVACWFSRSSEQQRELRKDKNG